MSSDDESTIRDIRNSFVKDGLSWSLDTSKKLIYLWNKNLQTESELQKTSNEVHWLRRQMKDEIASVQNNFAKVRELSSEKEHAMTGENIKLRKQVKDLTSRNDMLLQERVELEQLYSLQVGSSCVLPSNPFRYFLEERTDLVKKANMSNEDLKKVNEELSRMKSEFDESETTVQSLEKELAQCLASSEVERSRMDTIKADHEKQHKLHRKQIQDLREKLSEFETTKIAKDEDNMSSMSYHLKEALSEVSLLSSELNKSTGVAGETDRLNLILNEELSRANQQNEQLTRRIEELTNEMESERERSIEMLEQQLEKEHELESFLESTQLEVHAHKRTVQILTDELAREQELCEELQEKIQDLEQNIHKKNAVTLEKEFLQQAVNEHESTIEMIESEHNALQRSNQDLSQKCQMLEGKIREQLSTMEELSRELSEVLCERERCGREKAELEDRIASLEEENHVLTQSMTYTRSRMESLSAESLTQTKQQREQQEAMESQLIILQNEKNELMKMLEEESAQHDSMREYLTMTVAQLQDELHSKCEELSRSRVETQKASRDIAAMKQNLDKEVVVKRETDLKFETLQLKNQSLLQEIQDLQHEKETLSKQMQLEKEHKQNQMLATQKLVTAEKSSLEEENRLEIAILKTEMESVIKEKERMITALSAKLDGTVEVYKKRVETMQENIDNSQEKMLELQLNLETKSTALNCALKKHKEDEVERILLESKLKLMQAQFDNATIQFSASKEKLHETKLQLEKQLETLKQEHELSTQEGNKEKNYLQGQIDSLQEQKLAMDQELGAQRTLLDREKLSCEFLKKSSSEKEGELEVMEGLLEKTQVELAEMSNKLLEKEECISDLMSKLDTTKSVHEATEKELKIVQDDDENLKSSLDQMRITLQQKEQEMELLQSKLGEKSTSIDEVQAALEEKEQKLEDTIIQLMEVDALWLKTQTELESEKAERSKLEQESRKVEHSRNKEHQQVAGLLQEGNKLRSIIKELRHENAKMVSSSRRSESRLAKKIKELDGMQADKKKLEEKVTELKLESSSVKEQLCQQTSSTHTMSDTHQEELRAEKLKVLLREQTISSLEKKLERMTASVSEMESILKQKEEGIYHSEVAAREQKIKAQVLAEKVEELISEKEALKSTIYILREEYISQKSTVIKLQTKLESYKTKYSIKKKCSKDQLASTWSDFSQKKQVLESSLDDMKKQLRVVQKKLDIEYRWKNTSDGLHQKILLEKSELIAKLGVAEKELGEKGQDMSELEVKLERMHQENVMLDERNKMLVSHIRSSRTSLQEQESQKILQRMSSSGGGIHSLMSSPISPSNHFHCPLGSSRLTRSNFTFSKSIPIQHSTPRNPSTCTSSISSSSSSPLPLVSTSNVTNTISTDKDMCGKD